VKRASSALAVVICLVVAVTAPGVTHAATVVYQDGTFPDASWTTSVEGINGGGTGSGIQFASGGNPDAYRRTYNTTNSATGTGVSNTVLTFHRMSGAVYDPSTSGPIVSIDYSEASIRLSGGVQACAIALRQNGIVYYGPGFLNPTTFSVWATTTQTGLVATDFDAIAPGLQTPNFTGSGGPIEFGFSRSNSTSTGGPGSTTIGGIDNWTVTLNTEQPVPTALSTWGKIKSLYRD
jgi:hypothetical protein